MAKTSSRVEMSITELRRTGDLSFEDSLVSFRWSSDEHSSAQGVIDLYLKMNHTRKVMPGGNRVVHHMMSAVWEPFTIEGEWSDMWGNRRSPGNLSRSGAFAFATYQDFADFCRRMPTVRFEIEQLSLVGVITDLHIRYQRATRIGWQITLSPEANENLSVDRVPTLIQKSVPAWLLDAKRRGDEMNLAFSKIKKLPFKTPHVDAFTRLLLDINESLDRLQRVGTQGFDSGVEHKLLLLATTFRRLRGSGLSMAIAMARLSSSAHVAYDDIMMSYRHAEWIASSVVLAYHMVGLSRAAEEDMRHKAGRGQNARSLYYPRENESLERISMKFYGSADNWRVIYKANNLNSLILSGDEELIIPRGSAT